MVNLVSRMSLHEDENQHEMRTILAKAEAFAPADSIDPANDDDELNPATAVIQDNSTKKRSGKLTEKGLCMKKSTLHNRRKMNSRLLRQPGVSQALFDDVIQGCYRIFMNDCPDFSVKYSVFPLTSALTTIYIFPDLV